MLTLLYCIVHFRKYRFGFIHWFWTKCTQPHHSTSYLISASTIIRDDLIWFGFNLISIPFRILLKCLTIQQKSVQTYVSVCGFIFQPKMLYIEINLLELKFSIFMLISSQSFAEKPNSGNLNFTQTSSDVRKSDGGTEFFFVALSTSWKCVMKNWKWEKNKNKKRRWFN